MSRQFELTLPLPPFSSFIPLQQTGFFFFQLCFSVKTISSSLWTRARPRLCRPVSPTSTVLNAWWRTGLSFYALPLPQSPLLAPPRGAQGLVTRGRVGPTSNKSQRGASTQGRTDPPFDIFIFLLHSISPFQAPGDQPAPPPPQLAALGFICRNLTTGSFPRPNEASPSGGKGAGFGRNLGWVEGIAGFLWLSKASPPLVGSTAPSSCLLIWLWEVWRTNFIVSSAG